MSIAPLKKHWVLPIACALLLATGGCSILFMDKIVEPYDPTRVPNCTPNSGTVIVDAVFGASYLSSAVGATTSDESSSDGDEKGVALTMAVLGAVSVISAIMYMGEADKCRRAIDEHNHWIVNGGVR